MKKDEEARQPSLGIIEYNPRDKKYLPDAGTALSDLSPWPDCILRGQGADPETGEPGPLCESIGRRCACYGTCPTTSGVFDELLTAIWRKRARVRRKRTITEGEYIERKNRIRSAGFYSRQRTSQRGPRW